MVPHWSLVKLVEVLLHQLLLLSNELCACLAPRRRHPKPVCGKGRVGLANMWCWAPKPGREVVVAMVVMVMRCGRGVENRRSALAGRRIRRRTLVTGGRGLAGGMLRVDVIPDDEVDGHLVRAAKLCTACQMNMLKEGQHEGISVPFALRKFPTRSRSPGSATCPGGSSVVARWPVSHPTIHGSSPSAGRRS